MPPGVPVREMKKAKEDNGMLEAHTVINVQIGNDKIMSIGTGNGEFHFYFPNQEQILLESEVLDLIQILRTIVGDE
jgi:hypothetical protein